MLSPDTCEAFSTNFEHPIFDRCAARWAENNFGNFCRFLPEL